MRLYVFGPPRLELAGRPLQLNQRRALALVAYLADTRRPHSREHLAALLWSESDDQAARARLRRTLHRLAQALPVDVIEGTGDTLRIAATAELWVDCVAFTEQAELGLNTQQPAAERLAALTQAAGLSTGDFLAGFTLPDSVEWDDWQFLQRESLRQLTARVLEELVQVHQGRQAWDAALRYARRWLSLDVFHEPAHRAVMASAAAAGQPGVALRQYQECVRLLRHELGVEPQAATTELDAAIRARRYAGAEFTVNGARVAPPGPAAEPAHRAEPGAVQMVGRDAELDRLKSWSEQATGGERKVVFVTGEAGLGKTALVDAFLAQAGRRQPIRLARGQCIEHRGAGEAYLPVLEALTRLCQEKGGDEVIALLTRCAPTWLAQMPSLVSAAALEVLQQRTIGATRARMLREMVEALEAIAAERPLIFVLEDLHWSDYSTLDLLTMLARRPEPARLLVIGTYRPTDVQIQAHPLHSVVQELRLHRRCEDLALSFLTEAAIQEYLSLRFPESSLPEQTARILQESTDGNPLFMVNVVNSWIARGAIAQEETQWKLYVPLGSLADDLPESLRQLIDLQFELLAAEDQTILEAASVAGVEFSVAAVADVVHWPDDEVELRCAGLVRQRRFLEERGATEWPDGTFTARFGFIHQLYQHVLYERVPAGRRVRLHRQMGVRLEAGYGSGSLEMAAELASHFLRGRDGRRAVHYLHLATRQAQRRSAYQEAIQHLTTALDIVHDWPEGIERDRQELALQASLAPALATTKGWGSPEAEAAYVRAYDLCQVVPDAPQRFQVYFGLASLHEWRAEYQKSEQLMVQRLNVSDPRIEEDWYLESHELLACSYFHQGSFHQALGRAEEGLRHHDPKMHYMLMAPRGADPGVLLHCWAAESLWFLGFPDQALKRMHQALTLAQNHSYSLANAQNHAATIHVLRREPVLTKEWAEASMTLGNLQGYSYRVAIGTALRGWALAVLGQSETGIAQLQAGMEACLVSGVRIDHPYLLTLLAEAYGVADRIDQGLAAIAQALLAVNRSRDFFYEAELHRVQGALLLQTGAQQREVEAERCFHRALEVARRQRTPALELRTTVSLGRLWSTQGKVSDARQALANVYARFTEGFETPDLVEARSLLAALGLEPTQSPLVG